MWKTGWQNESLLFVLEMVLHNINTIIKANL